MCGYSPGIYKFQEDSVVAEWKKYSKAHVDSQMIPNVMNQLNPIEELYNMYLEEKDTLRIVEIEDDRLDFVSDIEGPADLYMDL